jgi:hypothetical protein
MPFKHKLGPLVQGVPFYRGRHLTLASVLGLVTLGSQRYKDPFPATTRERQTRTSGK